MAKRLSPEEVTTIVQSGDFNALLGGMEDHELECKSSPYRLDEESQKFELAKDVSAMANVSGGVVLIGVRTRKDATLSADVVCRVRPFEESHISIKQYSDVLREWCYPPLNTVDIRWWPSAGDKTRGIVAILVPSAASGNAPCLVSRAPLPETGQFKKGALFGYFERLRADVQPTSVQELSTVIRNYCDVFSDCVARPSGCWVETRLDPPQALRRVSARQARMRAPQHDQIRDRICEMEYLGTGSKTVSASGS